MTNRTCRCQKKFGRGNVSLIGVHGFKEMNHRHKFFTISFLGKVLNYNVWSILQHKVHFYFWREYLEKHFFVVFHEKLYENTFNIFKKTKSPFWTSKVAKAKQVFIFLENGFLERCDDFWENKGLKRKSRILFKWKIFLKKHLWVFILNVKKFWAQRKIPWFLCKDKFRKTLLVQKILSFFFFKEIRTW